VIQRRDGVDLALEAITEALGGKFDGYLASHARIARPVHFPHAACTEGRQDFVGTEPG
jgi:hypothetical protein